MGVEVPTEFRTVFISDLHVGWDKVSEAYLLAFLGTLRTRSLYLVGDVLEWMYRPSGSKRESVGRFLEALGCLERRGTQIYWISGNHDPASYLGDRESAWLSKAIPKVRILPHDRYQAINGRTYLIVHGDIYDYFTRRVSTWKQKLAEFLYPLYLKLLERSTNSRWIGALQNRKNNDPLLAIHAQAFRELMIELARSHECNGVICGHIHVPEASQADSVEYLNCGDWLEHRSYVAESETGQIRLIRHTTVE